MKDDGTVHTHNNSGSKTPIKTKTNALGDLYQNVTVKPLTSHHDTHMDTYVCTLIYCHMLKLKGSDLDQSGGYKRICRMIEELENTGSSEPRKRPMTLEEVGHTEYVDRFRETTVNRSNGQTQEVRY